MPYSCPFRIGNPSRPLASGVLIVSSIEDQSSNTTGSHCRPEASEASPIPVIAASEGYANAPPVTPSTCAALVCIGQVPTFATVADVAEHVSVDVHSGAITALRAAMYQDGPASPYIILASCVSFEDALRVAGALHGVALPLADSPLTAGLVLSIEDFCVTIGPSLDGPTNSTTTLEPLRSSPATLADPNRESPRVDAMLQVNRAASTSSVSPPRGPACIPVLSRTGTRLGFVGSRLQLPGLLPDQSDVCSVCLENFAPDYNDVFPRKCVVFTTCGHEFHLACLAQWEGEACPICRFAPASHMQCSICGVTRASDKWTCVVCGAECCAAQHAASAAPNSISPPGTPRSLDSKRKTSAARRSVSAGFVSSAASAAVRQIPFTSISSAASAHSIGGPANAPPASPGLAWCAHQHAAATGHLYFLGGGNEVFDASYVPPRPVWRLALATTTKGADIDEAAGLEGRSYLDGRAPERSEFSIPVEIMDTHADVAAEFSDLVEELSAHITTHYEKMRCSVEVNAVAREGALLAEVDCLDSQVAAVKEEINVIESRLASARQKATHSRTAMDNSIAEVQREVAWLKKIRVNEVERWKASMLSAFRRHALNLDKIVHLSERLKEALCELDFALISLH